MNALSSQTVQEGASSSLPAKTFGLATLCLTAATALLCLKQASRKTHDARRGKEVVVPEAVEPQPAPVAWRPSSHDDAAIAQVSRGLHGSAALLGLSVLTDSALEHYRGQFKNPGMYAPLLASLMTVLAGSGSAISKTSAGKRVNDEIYMAAFGIGLAGTAFHLYNVMRRPGGFSWPNLFYAAPLGAPAALSLSGILGLAASRLRGRKSGELAKWFGMDAGRVLAGVTGLGLAGTVGEAGLFHFRGAYQNPFMWLPVSLPPVASALMLRTALRPPVKESRLTRLWLSVTAFLGIAGVGFHGYGVARQMGGWKNWSQNLLSGPPLPAPPSFSALALAGRSALAMLKITREHDHAEIPLSRI